MDEIIIEPFELKYQWIEDVELLDRYHRGGYHPTNIDDEFCNGRYHVVHKLGFGSYSTVWLARDQSTDRFVALKILVAGVSEVSTESRMCEIIEEHRVAKSPGHEYVLQSLHRFYIDGPNGRHMCLVSEPAGFSIAVAKEISWKFSFKLHIARAIAAKVILGVQFLHGSGIIHGGGFNDEIFTTAEFKDFSTEQLYQVFSPPEKKPIERLDGEPLDETVPSHAIPYPRIALACEEVTDPTIVIADFGEAYPISEPRTTLNTPLLLCPPEALLHHGTLGMPADIWTLACTLVEILGHGTLFESFRRDPDQIMSQMVCALGKPPEGL
ncbi:MAG: hypothetical protein Q9223_007153 [Gallowayella weberi]